MRLGWNGLDTRGIGVQLPQAMSGRPRSIASIAGGALLLILALVYAGIAGLFALLASNPRNTILRIGDDLAALYSEFAYDGLVTFLALCLISGYAGLAAIGNWRGVRLVAGAAGGATTLLGFHGLWVYANMLIALPLMPFSIGMRVSPAVSLALFVVGIIVLWAVWRPVK